MSFVNQQSRYAPEFRRGNLQTNLTPLNEEEETEYNDRSAILPSFSTVTDQNSTFGPDSIAIADPLLDPNFLFSSDGTVDSARSNIRFNPKSDQLPRMGLTNGMENVESNNSEPSENYQIMQRRRQNKEGKLKKHEHNIKPENEPGYMGLKDLDEILRELEPERLSSGKMSKKKKKQNVYRKNKTTRVDENEEIEVEVELDQDDGSSYSPTIELKSTEDENSEKIIEIPIDENVPIESPKIDEIKIEDVKQKSHVDDVKIKDSELNVIAHLNIENIQKPPPLVEPLVDQSTNTIFTEDDLPQYDILRARWEEFLEKYAGRIIHHDDRKTNNKSSFRSASKPTQDGNRLKLSNGTFVSSAHSTTHQSKSVKKQTKLSRR